MDPAAPTQAPGAVPEVGPGEPEVGETPTPYGFDLDPGETITRVIHRSIFDFLPSAVVAVFILLAAIGLTYAIARFGPAFPFPPALGLGLILILLALALLIFFVGLFVFRRNVLIFTTVHLVLVEQNSLVSHRVSQIAFSRIQDVTGSKVGLLQALFNFGKVEIQSAGEHENFIFLNAPDPQDIADEALEIHERVLRQLHQPEPME